MNAHTFIASAVMLSLQRLRFSRAHAEPNNPNRALPLPALRSREPRGGTSLDSLGWLAGAWAGGREGCRYRRAL